MNIGPIFRQVSELDKKIIHFCHFDSISGCDIFKTPYYMENRFSDLNITAVSTSTAVDSSNLLSNESNHSHNHSHSLTIHSTNENNAPQHNHNNNNNSHLHNNNNNHLNNGTSIKAEDESSPSNLIIEDQESNNR